MEEVLCGWQARTVHSTRSRRCAYHPDPVRNDSHVHQVPCIILGIFAGLGIGLSALFQGRAAAAACDAQGETGQGLTNYFGALGIVETVAIFTMVFAIIAIMFIK